MTRPSLATLTAGNLAYHRAGGGEPLVLLHGLGETHVGWRPVLAELARDYDVIAFDLPGFGGTPALPAGRLPTAAAVLVAPVAAKLSMTPAGRFLFFSFDRSRSWNLPADDARDLLLSFAHSDGYGPSVLAGTVDVPAGLDRIDCPVLFVQGTTDLLVAAQTPRYLRLVPHARLHWLPGFSHVPISDDPRSFAALMRRFFRASDGDRRESVAAVS
jgi:pimeloyl-ACP methyl ester carboxylesterase